METPNSQFGKINLKDIGKGLLVSMGTTILTGSYQLLQNNAAIDAHTFKPLLIASLGAGISYVIKNVFTNSDNELGKEKF